MIYLLIDYDNGNRYQLKDRELIIDEIEACHYGDLGIFRLQGNVFEEALPKRGDEDRWEVAWKPIEVKE